MRSCTTIRSALRIPLARSFPSYLQVPRPEASWVPSAVPTARMPQVGMSLQASLSGELQAPPPVSSHPLVGRQPAGSLAREFSHGDSVTSRARCRTFQAIPASSSTLLAGADAIAATHVAEAIGFRRGLEAAG